MLFTRKANSIPKMILVLVSHSKDGTSIPTAVFHSKDGTSTPTAVFHSKGDTSFQRWYSNDDIPTVTFQRAYSNGHEDSAPCSRRTLKGFTQFHSLHVGHLPTHCTCSDPHTSHTCTCPIIFIQSYKPYNYTLIQSYKSYNHVLIQSRKSYLQWNHTNHIPGTWYTYQVSYKSNNHTYKSRILYQLHIIRSIQSDIKQTVKPSQG